MCVDFFGGDLLSSRVQAGRFMSRWFCALLPTCELPVHLAQPLEGNLFASCYCIDVFFSLCKRSTKPLLVRVSIGCMKYELRRLGSALVTNNRRG